MQIKETFTVTTWDEEDFTQQTTEIVHQGAVYRVVALKGLGWDLCLVKGQGAPLIRIMNADMPSSVLLQTKPLK